MTRLVWDLPNEKPYEYGVDRGVFYAEDSLGFVWNGLIRIVESSVGGEQESYYFDGVKYLDTVTPKNYKAALSAYSSPLVFPPYVGDSPVVPGFILTRQGKRRFGLSYRTFIGTDVGYKIHIIYNILATTQHRNYATITDSGIAQVFSWGIEAVPPVTNRYRPSAHYILDSTKVPPDVLKVIEDILYGTDGSPSRIPDVDELLDILKALNSLVIVPNEVTGLAALVSGTGDLSETKPEGLYRALPTTRLRESTVEGLYRLELE